jgi:hypothetical protein
MDHTARKAAIAAYKDRDDASGVYAVRCAATGGCWVGGTPDLTKVQNRLWFELKMGSSKSPALLAAFKAHGQDGFSFDVLEPLTEADLSYGKQRSLKEKAAVWRETLGAELI